MEDKGERGECDGEESEQSANSSKGPAKSSKSTGTETSLICDDSSTDDYRSSSKSFKDWEPKPELLKQLTAMGISKSAAKKALFCTGNNSAGNICDYRFLSLRFILI
jgi:hypothetical protein